MNTKFILSLFVLCLGSKVLASEIKNPFNDSPEEQAALKSWNPDELGDKFIYHEIMGHQWSNWKTSVPTESFSYKLLVEPEMIAQNPKISSSLISKKYRDVYIGGIGLALRVPPEHIVATFTSDARSTSMKSYDENSLQRLQLWARQARGAIKTPDYLIENSNGHNEVTVTGTIAELNSAVEVEAIVVNCEKDMSLNSLSDEEFKSTLEGCLKQSQLKYDAEAFKNVLPLMMDLKHRRYEILGLKLK